MFVAWYTRERRGKVRQHLNLQGFAEACAKSPLFSVYFIFLSFFLFFLLFFFFVTGKFVTYVVSGVYGARCSFLEKLSSRAPNKKKKLTMKRKSLIFWLIFGFGWCSEVHLFFDGGESERLHWGWPRKLRDWERG